ncbi:MAG: alpha/beta hydrolase-fold protein [Polyangiaceae bacterium]
MARGALFACWVTACNAPPTFGGSPPASAVGSVAPTSSSVAAAPAECAADACVDESTLSVCASGKASTKTCAADELCAGRACVAVTDPAGAKVPRARARRAVGDGFINAWSSITPVQVKAASAFLADGNIDAIGGAKAFKAACAPDGYVQPKKGGVGKDSGNVLSLAAASVWIDKARTLVLAVGSSGKLTVAVNGKTVIEHAEAKGIGKRAWADEQSVEVDMPAGASRVAVILDAPKVLDRAGGFYLRFRERSGAPAEGLVAMEAVEEAACAPSELVDLKVSLDVDKDGLFATTKPTFLDLVPTQRDAKLALALTGKSPATADVSLEEPLAPLRLTPDGAAELSIKDGERALFSVKLPASPALVSRVAALVAGMEDMKSTKPGAQASFENHVRYLVKLVTTGDDDTSFIERHVQRAEEILAAARRGEDPYAERTGVIYRAYRSKVDGRLQPYMLFVPPSYTKGTPLPVVIMSHGRNRSPELGLRTLIGQAPDDKMTLKWASRNWPAFPDQHAILVSVYGFDEGAAHPLGEEDVLDVIDELEREYRVDPLKISLTGFSLGGTVAFFVPMHYPDVFSATSPFCGYPNLLGFQNVMGVKRAPWEDAMLAKRYIVNYAENGSYVPVHVVHGGLDAPERSQVFVDRYRAVGNTALFDVQDDLNHDVWDYGYKDGRMVHWLSKKSRPESPKRVRFVTGEYRYDRSYWLRVVAMHDSTLPDRATIDAKLDEKAKRIEIKTENLDAFEIDRKRLTPAAVFQDAVTLAIDGAELPVPAGDAPLHLVKSSGWSLAATEPARDGMKRHGVSGPLADVLRHAIAVVYGTKDPAHASVNRIVAETIAANGGGPDVEYLVTARFPVMSDVEATDAAIADKSLILIGSPDDNALTARYADKLPVKFANGGIEIRKERYTGKGVGVSFIAPRPDDPDEYVVVHAGLDVDGTLAARSLPRFVPDFVVYDARLSVQRGGLLFDERPWLAGGFFDERWQ